MTKYFSTAETAKLIRKALAESFPGIKFSVRSHNYSGGSSINISWTDGPTGRMVDSVARLFQGSEFDGMQDLKTSTRANFGGELVRFGADHVFTRREHSPALEAQVKAAFARKFGRDALERLGEWEYHRLYQDMLHRRSLYLAPRESKTAAQISAA